MVISLWFRVTVGSRLKHRLPCRGVYPGRCPSAPGTNIEPTPQPPIHRGPEGLPACGPNGTGPGATLARQFRSPLKSLLGLTCHCGFDRARFNTHTPPIQMTTIASDAGLKRPAMASDAGNRAPNEHNRRRERHKQALEHGHQRPNKVRQGSSRETIAEDKHHFAVAIPPIRFPAARSRRPDAAAEMVIARSGSLPA